MFEEQPKVTHVEELPTVEDNKANEAGILEFLVGMDDHKAETAEIDGDAVGFEYFGA